MDVYISILTKINYVWESIWLLAQEDFYAAPLNIGQIEPNIYDLQGIHMAFPLNS